MSRLVKIYLFGCMLLVNQVYAVGLMPTPVLTNARISADAAFDPATGKYIYSYTVSNPASNTGEIYDIKIDVSADISNNGMANITGGLTIQRRLRRVDFATELFKRVDTNNRLSEPWPLQVQTIVPFGQNVPPGWFGGLGIDSVASFTSSDDTPNIVPGTSLGGFQLLSYGIPTIRDVQLIPFWVHVVVNHDAVSEADRLAAGQTEQDIIFKTVSLGPSGVNYGSFGHWNQLRDDLARAIQLGWVIDPALANSLTQQLATARLSLDAKDFYTAKILLQPMLDTISRSVSTQRTREGYALIFLNVQSLINNTPNNAVEPKISLTPKNSILSIGGNQNLTVSLIDLANGSKPLGGIPIRFTVDSGPNAGTVLGEVQTDLQGQVTVAYTSAQTGTDSIIAQAIFYGGEVTYDDKAIAIWSGGPDLAVPFFSPPLLITKGGKKFYMSEETQNIGNVMAQPSITRYYISTAPILNAATAQVVGERSIPSLQPGKSDSINQRVFYIPRNFIAGTLYLASCADANNTVLELNESNNCSFSKIEGRQSLIVPIKKIKIASENEEGDDEDDDNNKDHHDDDEGDSSKAKDSWFKNPFGKPEVKR